MRSTWDEIVSSGDVGLLPRGFLQSGIGAYYTRDYAQIAFVILQASSYRQHVRSLLSLPVQKAIRFGCSDVRDAAEQVLGFMAECKLELASDDLAVAATVLRGDPRLKAELHYQYSMVFTAHANIRGDVVFLERALAALKGAQREATVSP